jgi:hypothetical protein
VDVTQEALRVEQQVVRVSRVITTVDVVGDVTDCAVNGEPCFDSEPVRSRDHSVHSDHASPAWSAAIFTGGASGIFVVTADVHDPAANTVVGTPSPSWNTRFPVDPGAAAGG